MGREATITQEQVNAAADALRAAGQRPTVRAVRERLGSGTQVTVMRMLEVWRGGQVRPAETPLTLPAALQRALVDYVGQAVAEGKAGLANDLAELQQVNADLAVESERQVATIERLESELEATQRERNVQRGRIMQLEEDLAKANQELAEEHMTAELSRTELAKAQLRLEAMPRLEAELATLHAALEQERTQRAAAEQAAAVARATQEGEARALAKAEKELTTTHADLERQRAYGYDISDKYHQMQGELYKANASFSNSEYQLRHAQEELAAVRAQLAALQAGPADAPAEADPEPTGPATNRKRAK